jgi:hypothetical protein
MFNKDDNSEWNTNNCIHSDILGAIVGRMHMWSCLIDLNNVTSITETSC